jgi:hypothetical protein
MSDWQTPVALVVVVLAGLLAFRTIVFPFIKSMKVDEKASGCGGGCGCSKTVCETPKDSAKTL